jgi:hypothetical protein
LEDGWARREEEFNLCMPFENGKTRIWGRLMREIIFGVDLDIPCRLHQATESFECMEGKGRDVWNLATIKFLLIHGLKAGCWAREPEQFSR